MASNCSLPLLQLPGTALIGVLALLAQADKQRLRQACQASRYLVNSNTTKLQLLPDAGQVAPQLQARFPAVRELDLCGYGYRSAAPQVLEQLLVALAAVSWPSVTTLHLPWDLGVFPAAFVARACSYATKLNIWGEYGSQDQIAAVLRGACSCLPQLAIVDTHAHWKQPTGDAPLLALARSCKALRSFSCSISCSDLGLQALWALTSLTHLDLHMWFQNMANASPGWLAGLSSLSALVSLSISASGSRRGAADLSGLERSLSCLKALTRLDVTWLPAGSTLGLH